MIPRLFTERVVPVDVAMVAVSPPDEHGFCSFGIEVGVTKPAALAAREGLGAGESVVTRDGIWLGQGLTRLVAATVSELYYSVSVMALHLDVRAVLLATGLGIGATLLATDNINLEADVLLPEVTLFYPPEDENGNGTYVLLVPVPDYSTAPLYYAFTVVDSSNNTNSTAEWMVEVLDVKKPVALALAVRTFRPDTRSTACPSSLTPLMVTRKL